jgi:hypothetical protein
MSYNVSTEQLACHTTERPEVKHQQPPQNVRLLIAREAALWLEVNPRTSQLWARRALKSGDPVVQIVAGAYCAPDWWWKMTLAKPIKPGRPRKAKA